MYLKQISLCKIKYSYYYSSGDDVHETYRYCGKVIISTSNAKQVSNIAQVHNF